MDIKDYITLRVRKDTQRKLKIVAALCEESMLDTLDRLVSREYEHVHGSQKGQAQDVPHQEDQD
jgi:hypothetical protein